MDRESSDAVQNPSQTPTRPTRAETEQDDNSDNDEDDAGSRYDISYCRLSSLEKQAWVRSRLEKRSRHPKVVMKRRLLA